MGTSVPFFVVDVFADTPLTGNPLAVVAAAERIEESVMRSLAREFNQSETTFVLPPTLPEATWRLRSFTPAGAEVVGAGHNVLGAWWWLATSGRIELDADGEAAVAQEFGGRVLPSHRAWCPTGRSRTSSRATPSDGRAGSGCGSAASASGSAGRPSSCKKARSPCEEVQINGGHR